MLHFEHRHLPNAIMAIITVGIETRGLSSIVFNNCAEFCERWDQSSFDPDYPMEPIDTFEPMVREVFSRKAYDPEIIQEGFVSSLTGEITLSFNNTCAEKFLRTRCG